jgi:L-amino acid N-acyltransferase YncA
MRILEDREPADFSRYFELLRLEWPREWPVPTDETIRAEMEKSYDAGSDVVKYLEDEGRILGWYRYTRWPRDGEQTDIAHTLDIAVVAECQGRGYGSILLEDMKDDCRKRGYRILMSRTMLSNPQSIGFHGRTGFKEASRQADSIIWEIGL